MNILALTVLFAASTNCSPETREFLNIPANDKCDVIEWRLEMSEKGTYNLAAAWKYYPDNRTLLKQGEITDVNGSWKMNGSICTLTSKEETLYLLKLDDNLYQILDKDKKILRGSEGYANTLNRVNPVVDTSIDFKPESNDVTPKEMIITGRTPLKPFDKLLEIVDNEDHFKIKWIIKIHADGTVDVRKILEHPGDYKGKWTVSNNIYKLEFEGHTLQLLKASEDVYYFMTKEDCLLVGNDQFGMSLIRRVPSGR